MPIALTLPMPPAKTLAREAAEAAPGSRDRAAAGDAALLAWTVGGDRLAFDALAGRHLHRLHRLALRILGDAAEAEDVTQDAMLRAWEAAADYDASRGAVGTWLQRILVNRAIDRLRRRGRQPTVPMEWAEAVPDDGPGAEEELQHAQEAALLRQAMEHLPARQRAAIALAYEQGLSGAEAAAALDVSARGLEGLLHRARQALAGRLGGLLGREGG
ncbi:sigma-70 family RNA polymerase sigma factor [Acetobacteraceae bacterium H6797]|nr:sigma-70 family RNA polymerase sigma factor [Acetobacteraceae bacterium H6797]